MEEHFRCSMCYFISGSLKEFTRHNVRLHKNDQNFIVYYSVGSCNYITLYSSRSWNTFKIHVRRKHEYLHFINHAACNCPEAGFLDEEIENIDNLDFRQILDPDIQRNFLDAAYLLRLETEHNL